MKYRYLGQTGLAVSRVCLGTMTFGQEGWGCDEAAANEILHTFLEQGGNFIDTADVYSNGASEQILGRALKDLKRDELVIASKGFFRRGPTALQRGLSRKHIISACEASLRRLNIDYLDLYQIHGPDPQTPIEETLRALDDLVRQGKVRYIGCSNLFAWQIVQANLLARQQGLAEFCSAQHLFNLILRDVEREILPACRNMGLGMICWSPMAGGMLSGKYTHAEAPLAGSRIALRAQAEVPRFWHERGFRITSGLREVATRLSESPQLLALAWLLATPGVTAVIAGVRDATQMLENCKAGSYELPPEVWEELDRLAEFDRGYPATWIALNATPQFQDVER